MNVTNTEGVATPQPGWYPDPAGSTQLRWWDGTGWTQHLQPSASASASTATAASAAASATEAGQAAGFEQEQGHGRGQGTAQAQGHDQAQTQYAQNQYAPNPYAQSTPVQPPLGAHPAIYTPFIWIIALLPLLSAIAIAALDMRFMIVRPSQLHSMVGSPMLGSPMYIVVSLLGWVIYGVGVWMAYLDWRALGRIGIVNPFHWAWAFLTGIVYVIGRSVVVRRRVGGHALIPVWVIAGVYLLTFIIMIVKVAALLSSALALYTVS
jgi:hypothetical protein